VGFLSRVRARALRAPVIFGSLTRKTARCAPPAPAYRSFADPSGDINDIHIEETLAKNHSLGKKSTKVHVHVQLFL